MKLYAVKLKGKKNRYLMRNGFSQFVDKLILLSEDTPMVFNTEADAVNAMYQARVPRRMFEVVAIDMTFNGRWG